MFFKKIIKNYLIHQDKKKKIPLNGKCAKRTKEGEDNVTCALLLTVD